MRLLFDRPLRVRGYSVSPGGAYLGFWLWLLLLPILAIPYYFPRAVWRSSLQPGAKLLIIGGVWAGLIAIGEIAAGRTADQAAAAGCISIDQTPSWYLAPLDDRTCPLEYTPRLGCELAMTGEPGDGTGRCPQGEKPRLVAGGSTNGPAAHAGCIPRANTVPTDLIGLELDAAESELRGCGIAYNEPPQVIVASNWTVCATSPPPGSPVPVGPIDLSVNHASDCGGG